MTPYYQNDTVHQFTSLLVCIFVHKSFLSKLDTINTPKEGRRHEEERKKAKKGKVKSERKG